MTKTNKKQLLEKKAKQFMKANKRFVNEANKGINRSTVLNSNLSHKLPSSKGTLRLKNMCASAYEELEQAKQKYAERAKITANTLFLKEKHKHDASRINELPHIYLNDKKLRVLTAKLKEAETLFELLTTAYRNKTGRIWKPAPSKAVHEPIEF